MARSTAGYDGHRGVFEVDMNDFTVTVRVDTPVLEGGPPDPFKKVQKRALDLLFVARPPALRGLMHTFARAIFAPILDNEDGELLKAERSLLGAQGGRTYRDGPRSREFGSTFSVTASLADPAQKSSVPIRPGANKGSADAYQVGHPDLTIRVSPHPWAVAEDPCLPAMLWEVLWCGLSFGGIGLRSRRGYGSLTVVKADPEPRCPTWAAADDSGLPCFPDPPTRGSLETNLKRGFTLAQACAMQWLRNRAFKTTAPPKLGDAFFQVAGLKSIHVGAMAFLATSTTKRGWEVALTKLMNECHEQKSAHAGYGATLGRIKPKPRLASPLWVRLYRVKDNGQEAWVPVATLGAKRLFDASSSPEPMTRAILAALDGPSSSGLSPAPAGTTRPPTAPASSTPVPIRPHPISRVNSKWPRRRS